MAPLIAPLRFGTKTGGHLKEGARLAPARERGLSLGCLWRKSGGNVHQRRDKERCSIIEVLLLENRGRKDEGKIDFVDLGTRASA